MTPDTALSADAALLQQGMVETTKRKWPTYCRLGYGKVCDEKDDSVSCDCAAMFTEPAAPQAQVTGEILSSFKFADSTDWDYLETVLKNAQRHASDAQTGFWMRAIKELRLALASHSAAQEGE